MVSTKYDGSIPTEKKPFTELMYNSPAGRIVILIGVLMGVSAFCNAITSYFGKTEPVVQRQIIGNEKPDIFIERDGVRYFSHVDGKDISDLLPK